jgi:hypothetical protein
MVIIILLIVIVALIAVVLFSAIHDLAKVLLVMMFVHQIITLYETRLWSILKKKATIAQPKLYKVENSDKKAVKKKFTVTTVIKVITSATITVLMIMWGRQQLFISSDTFNLVIAIFSACLFILPMFIIDSLLNFIYIRKDKYQDKKHISIKDFIYCNRDVYCSVECRHCIFTLFSKDGDILSEVAAQR